MSTTPVEERRRQLSSSWLAACTKCIPIFSSSSSSSRPAAMLPTTPVLLENQPDDSTVLPYKYSPHPPPNDDSKSETIKRRTPGGWKSMPFVLGNETFERLATIGLLANFTVFLMTKFHMDQVHSANLINIWSGVNNFAPLLGAFISDAYVGKFRTIAFCSFASLLGMVTMTLIASVPHLLPSPCTPEQLAHPHQCKGPTTTQVGILIMGLGFLSVGTGGIRPCSLPFGVDQFDPTTDEGRKGINSFFNWYYATFTVVLIIALTLVVYIQDSVSWIWGFSIPTMLMFCSIILFFVGTRLYVYVKPGGSIFSGIAQAFVAAYKKRKVKLPSDDDHRVDGVYYNPPPTIGTYKIPNLPLTNRFRFLNKAAVIMDGEVKADGSVISPWTLSSVQRIEEVKCLIKVIPILASGIISFTSMAQQGTFTVSQALKMDRHLGPNFQIPAGTLAVISMITIGLWIPFYDRILVPALRKITKIDGGITLLQRIGIGMVFSILSMVVAGMIEKMRRDSAVAHGRPDGIAPISVMWLAPQLVLMGFSEAFNIIGQIEFYYKEFPENMKSVANSLFFVTAGGANYVSSALIMIVHKVTGRHGRPDWLTANINAGRVDYFYYVIAGMGIVNLMYFLLVAQKYEYKTKMEIDVDGDSNFDVELNDVKK